MLLLGLSLLFDSVFFFALSLFFHSYLSPVCGQDKELYRCLRLNFVFFFSRSIATKTFLLEELMLLLVNEILVL